MNRKTFHQLYAEHNGKVSDKWSLYLSEYERLLNDYHDKPVCLLEIGIQNGGSLEIWSKYFVNATALIGCDINPECSRLSYDDPRIDVIVGDANTLDTSDQIFARCPQFDIIIDDGSHRSSDIVKSFARYFPHLTNGGIYVVEDLHCGYWQEFEGGLFDPHSSIIFFKRLADIVSHEHWGINKSRKELLAGFAEHYDVSFDEETLSHVHSIEFINSLCVIRKFLQEDNQLGYRVVSGQLEPVLEGHASMRGQRCMSFDQSTNIWAARAIPPDEEYPQLLNELAERDGQIANLNQDMKEREEFIVKLNHAIAERDGQIANLNQNVKEREEFIVKLNHSIAERDGQIATLNQALVVRDEQIANLHLAADDCKWEIASLNNTIAMRDLQIAQTQSTVREILDSTSWKLTKPVRFLGRVILYARKIIAFRRAIFYLVFQYCRRESVYKLFKRTIYIIHHEGLEGFKVRLKAFNANQTKKTKPVVRLERPTYLPLSTIDITKYDFFFLDVFDTAIIRLFQQPIDLFEYISHKTKDHDFHIRRIYKEKSTRELYSERRDISIFDLYNDFSDVKIEEEIATELKFCVANPEVYIFYLKLLSAGKKIYFVSDMYLDKLTITEILEKNGFSTYEDIFVSSEDDFIKGDGSRFDWLKKNIPESIGTAIHIGDNIVADFIQPRSHGFDALHFMESHAYYLHDSFLNSKIEFLNSKRSLGLSFLVAIFRYWKSGFHDQLPDYWRQFGFLYGGALVSAFCGFINEQLSRKNFSCTKIYFLARDGDIMSQVYRLLYDDTEAVYLMASRRCMIFPSIKSLTHSDDAEAIRQFCGPLGNTSAHDILDRFGYSDLGNLEMDLKNIGPDPSKWSERDITDCFIRNKKSIMEKAVMERQMLFNYLSGINFFDQDDIVIADVGWGGTIQDSLVKLLNLWGYQKKRLHGIYLGVNEMVAHKRNKIGFLFDGNRSKFFEYFNLIELITSSPKDGIIRIDYADGDFVPITGKISEHEKHRQFVAAEIQKGIIDFAHIVKKQNIDGLDFIQPDDFRSLFESLQNHASEEDVFQFGKIKHANMIGNLYAHPVLNIKTQ